MPGEANRYHDYLFAITHTGIPTQYTEDTEIRDLDMILTQEQMAALDAEVEKYKGIKGDIWRWPGGVIPYEVDASWSECQYHSNPALPTFAFYC